jgi:hypothetical protein
LVARLLAHKPYMDKYHQYLEQLLKGGFAEGIIEARIDELVKIIKPFVEADNLKFFSIAEFERGIEGIAASGGQEGISPEMGPMQRGGGEFSQGQFPGGGRGAMGARGVGRGGGGGPGMNAPMLKPFIKQRRLSVREQLDGKRPSRGQEGEQREGPDMFNGLRGNPGGPG